MSRLQLLKNVSAETFRRAATGELNNTTASVEVDVLQSGKYAFLVDDLVTAFAGATYDTPDLDPNARIGVVTARSNTKVTVTWGVLGTPISAISGRATLGLVQRGGGRSKVELGEDETADDNAVIRTSNFTLAAVDSGVVQRIGADGVVATLPNAAPGATFIFVNDGDAAGDVGFSVSPDSDDTITGGGLATPVANKDVINTKATANPGDTLVVVGGASNNYYITRIAGVFAREG